MRKQKWLGVYGSLLLMIIAIPKIPLVDINNNTMVKFTDPITLYIRIAIALLGVTSFFLIGLNKHRGLWITGLLSTALMAYSAIRIRTGLETLRAMIRTHYTGFARVCKAGWENGFIKLDIRWGFTLLVIGTLLILLHANIASHYKISDIDE